jgi:hypothetical protein
MRPREKNEFVAEALEKPGDRRDKRPGRDKP